MIWCLCIHHTFVRLSKPMRSLCNQTSGFLALTQPSLDQLHWICSRGTMKSLLVSCISQCSCLPGFGIGRNAFFLSCLSSCVSSCSKSGIRTADHALGLGHDNVRLALIIRQPTSLLTGRNLALLLRQWYVWCLVEVWCCLAFSLGEERLPS